jgi:CrcB protein
MVGGALGAVARYALSGFTVQRFPGAFPFGTLTVNLSGCIIIGVVWSILEHITVHENLRLFLIMGLLGGFTTFSAFSMETVNLLKEGAVKLALLNVILHTGLGIVFTVVGYAVTQFFVSSGR